MRSGVRALWSKHRGPASLLALALVVRAGAAAVAKPAFYPGLDPTDYLLHARSIAAGHGYPPYFGGGPSAFRPPGYPYFLAGVFRIGGIRTAQLAHCALGALAVALIGFIANELWGRRVALCALALGSVYPPLIVLGLPLMSEVLFLPLVLGALAATLVARRHGQLRWVCAAGALVGLATLTRPNAALMVVPLVVGVWRPTEPRRSAVRALALAGVAVVVVAPWTVRNAVVMHAFVPVSTQVGPTAAGTYNPVAAASTHFAASWRPPTEDPMDSKILFGSHLGELAAGRQLQARAFRYLTGHVGYALKATGLNVLRTFDLTGFAWAEHSAEIEAMPKVAGDVEAVGFWLFAFVGLVGLASPYRRRAPIFVWAVPVLLIASTVWFESETRFRAPADAYVVILAALGIAWLWAVVERNRRTDRQPPGRPADCADPL